MEKCFTLTNIVLEVSREKRVQPWFREVLLANNISLLGECCLITIVIAADAVWRRCKKRTVFFLQKRGIYILVKKVYLFDSYQIKTNSFIHLLDNKKQYYIFCSSDSRKYGLYKLYVWYPSSTKTYGSLGVSGVINQQVKYFVLFVLLKET